jgi:hypothetical protein
MAAAAEAFGKIDPEKNTLQELSVFRHSTPAMVAVSATPANREIRAALRCLTGDPNVLVDTKWKAVQAMAERVCVQIIHISSIGTEALPKLYAPL